MTLPSHTDRLGHGLAAVCLALAAFALPRFVCAATVDVDVFEWAAVGSGVTAGGWTVRDLDSYADGSTRFNAKGDFALSPRFATVITQVTMRVKSSSPEATRFLTIAPTDSASATVHRADPTAKGHLAEETFRWAPSENVYGFRLRIEGEGSTAWGIAALSIYTCDVATPTGLRDEPLYRDAFLASWDEVRDAKRYQVRYAQVETTPPRYETLAEWDFSALTNATGNSKGLEALREEFPAVLDGVTGMNLGLQKYDGGHLQIGKGKVAGEMELQLEAAVPSRICLITNWRHDKDLSSGCQAFCLCGDGSTNAVVALTAAASPATDMFALPDGACRLRVESLKSRRVEISSVIVATDYSPRMVMTNEFRTAGMRTTEKMVKGLEPGDWVWSVRAFDAKDADSPWSAFRSVTLDASDPPRPIPGLSLFLR